MFRHLGRFAPLATVLVVVLAVAACGGQTSGGGTTAKIKMAYLAKHLDNPWFVRESAGAKQKAQQLNVVLTVQDLQFDANLALSAVDTVIATGTKAIAIVVPDQKIGPAVIQKANTAKVPILAIDDTIKDSSGKPAPFVGFDASALGTGVGQHMVELYKQSGWAGDKSKVVKAASIEDQTLSVCQDRTTAATKEFLQGVPDFGAQNVLHIPYQNTLVSATNVFATVITAHPEVTDWLFWSCNDDGVLGSIRAWENAGHGPGTAIGIGLGGNQSCQEWNKGKPTDYKGTMYVDSAAEGAAAIQNLYDKVTRGKTIQDRTIVPPLFVTQADYKQKMQCF